MKLVYLKFIFLTFITFFVTSLNLFALAIVEVDDHADPTEKVIRSLPSTDMYSQERIAVVNSDSCIKVHSQYNLAKNSRRLSEVSEKELVHMREFFFECAKYNKKYGKNQWQKTIYFSETNQAHYSGNKKDALRKIFAEGFNAQTASRTKYLVSMSAAVLFFLSQFPDSSTHWKSNTFTTNQLVDNWDENVTHKPVWDKDPFYINFIAHPMAGSWYYLVARQAGHTAFESFIYSFLVSTFIWEYGIEAIPERPSVQDLVLTPVVGSLIGEGSHQMIEHIKSNHGKIIGSQALGAILIWALDPINSIAEQFQNSANGQFDISKVRWQVYYGSLATNPFVREDAPQNPRIESGRSWLFQFNIPFDVNDFL